MGLTCQLSRFTIPSMPEDEKPISGVSRRNILKSATLVAAGSAAVLAQKIKTTMILPSHAPILAYVGEYTPNGQGIYLFRLDPSSGLTQIKVAAVIQPFLDRVHPKGKFLYAVNEISNFNGGTSGSVTALSINRTTGDFTFLNVVSSQGGGPAHLSVDPWASSSSWRTMAVEALPSSRL